MDCLFCKIVAGEIPSTKVYEDDAVYAFRDIAPQAPVHIVIVPKAHIAENIDALTDDTAVIAARCLAAMPKIAAAEGLSDGYRVITNVGTHGGQTVYHLHFHLLGGSTLGETLVVS